jgi:hypothetical protein
MQADPKSTPAPDSEQLAALERRWAERFEEQPKLPTSALLTGAVSMALAFGAVLFLLSKWMRGYAWIWIVLSIAAGIINRMLAARWYKEVVIPWDLDRRSTAQQIQELRARTAPPASQTGQTLK